MATYLVTGTAGFIASRVASHLLDQGHRIVGGDNMNDYYDVRLKDYRISQLKQRDDFSFFNLDIEDRDTLWSSVEGESIAGVLNLAARAGDRYSMENP